MSAANRKHQYWVIFRSFACGQRYRISYVGMLTTIDAILDCGSVPAAGVDIRTNNTLWYANTREYSLRSCFIKRSSQPSGNALFVVRGVGSTRGGLRGEV